MQKAVHRAKIYIYTGIINQSNLDRKSSSIMLQSIRPLLLNQSSSDRGVQANVCKGNLWHWGPQNDNVDTQLVKQTHLIKISDVAIFEARPGTAHKAAINGPSFKVLAPISTKLAYLSMLFVFLLAAPIAVQIISRLNMYDEISQLWAKSCQLSERMLILHCSVNILMPLYELLRQ